MLALRICGWLLAMLFAGIGVIEFLDDSGQAFFALVVVVLAAAVVGGIALIPRRPWPGAVLASLGAVIGAFMLFWSLVAIPLAIAVVVLAVVAARRESAAAS